MSELFESLGFFSNPFSRFSAEEELDYLEKVFLPPRYFQVLAADVFSGASRFIVGNRGSGKSALMYRIFDTIKDRNAFPVLVDSYTGVPTSNNAGDLVKLVIENAVTDLSVLLLIDKHRRRFLSKHQKQTLATLLSGYALHINQTEFNDRLQRLQSLKTRRFLVKIINNWLRIPINVGVSFGVEAFSDLISKSIGLPKPAAPSFYHDYLPALDTSTLPKSDTITPSSLDFASQKKVLHSVEEIAMACGFQCLVVFFDKIDEFAKLEGKVSRIIDFLSGICTDTSLLQSRNLSFVFVLWSKTRTAMSEAGVRFDKFKPVDVNWIEDDIAKILGRRVDYFSGGNKKPQDILDHKSLSEVIQLANGSPRDLITVLSHIYDEQSMLDVTSDKFQSDAISRGTKCFVTKYDYVSFYASKDIAQNVVSSINRILQVGKLVFNLRDIADMTKKSQASASNYTRAMRDYGLVTENEDNVERTKEYRVVDPKVKHLIFLGIRSISE